MSIVQEIIHETKQETRVKLKRNAKRLLITLGIISISMSIIFYVLGFPYQDSLYRQLPMFAGMPLLAVSSFNAFAITSIVMFFIKSLGEVTNSTVKNSLEQRRENKIKTQAKAIVDRVDQYGQRDYSLQINEAKQGLRHEVLETKTDVNDWKKFTSELARRFSIKSFVTDLRVSKLERQVKDLQKQLDEQKKINEESKTIIADKIQGNNKIEDTKL